MTTTTTLELRCECLGLPAAGGSRLLWVALAAAEIPRKTERAPISLAVVLDRSGSMRGAKLDYAKQAAVETIRALDGRDRFSVVTYDNEIELICPSQPATPANRRSAEQAIAAVEARGMTALHGGWQRGCAEVEASLGPDQLGRCLLLTDGLANEGLTERGAIVLDVARQRGRRVATSTFGVGADFDEALLQGMAEAGAGNFYFIDQPAQIVDFIASEVGEVLEIAVPDASLVVRVSGAGEGVELRSLNDYPVTPLPAAGGDRAWSVELGSLVSGQLLDPLLGLELPAAAVGTELRVSVALCSRGEPSDAPTRELVLRYLDADGLAAAPVDLEPLRRGAALDASRVSQQGLQLNREGQLDAARALLSDAAAALRARARADPELLAIAAELDDKAQRYSTPIDAMSRKAQYFADYQRLKGKGAGGRSRRVGQDEPPTPTASRRPGTTSPSVISHGPNIVQGANIEPSANVVQGPNIGPGPNIVQGANIGPSPNIVQGPNIGPSANIGPGPNIIQGANIGPSANQAGPELTPATGVVVLPTSPALVEQANRAVFVLASAAAELLPRLRAYPVLVQGSMAAEHAGRELSIGEERELIDRAVRLAPNASVRLVITGRSLRDGWFSHTYPDQRTAIATLYGWARISSVRTESFLAYQMLIHGLVATSPRYRQRDLLHDDTRGCLFDLCADKVEINDKLRHADLCLDCERGLASLGVEIAQLRAAAAVIHRLA